MLLIDNRQAKREFEIASELTAGIVLSGPEVKSLRLKMGSLKGSYVKIMGNEAFLVNAQINPYKFARQEDYDPKRTRKILLSKSEINKIRDKTDQKGWGVVPVSINLINNRIKVKIGVGKGRKEYEKKQLVKEKDLKREFARERKNSY